MELTMNTRREINKKIVPEYLKATKKERYWMNSSVSPDTFVPMPLFVHFINLMVHGTQLKFTIHDSQSFPIPHFHIFTRLTVFSNSTTQQLPNSTSLKDSRLTVFPG